ncbi:hypothetical protein WA026_014028 [Henosepilachna vigintioctopunctata]|uniref:Coiled-coil domain-containing protein 22 homolog n=1 Tax=Henosepilachna vigintioctopunctata TaxID=420089 RepID=A0AAW1U7K9_9CUCU
MDEVDNIIIETLKALNCDITEEISSLKQFDDNLVVQSISSCLEAIIPSSKFPKKLSPSMAIRLKTASYLAEQVKDIGFKDEIGYQTILYFNEIEIRRLLIFLIEKLPKDLDNFPQVREVGYVPEILSVLKQKLKTFPALWIPPQLLNRGVHIHENNFYIHSYGNSIDLNIKKLKIPSQTDANNSNNSKFYNIHILPVVTNQCTNQQLIPSLLFEDCIYSKKNKSMLDFITNIPIIGKTDESLVDNNNKIGSQIILREEIDQKEMTKEAAKPINQVLLEADNIQNISENFKVEEQKYLTLKKTVDDNQSFLNKLNLTIKEEEEILQDKTNCLKIKMKTMAILSQEENLHKLKQLVEKANSRLLDLAKQWNEVKGPLLEEYNSLKASLLEEDSVLQEKQHKFKSILAAYDEMLNDLKHKVELEQKLIEKHQQQSKNTNRSTYTKNIMEIIGNIKKQNHEMQKILKDTKDVQKDINSLTGQIERSFTISDELIFLNAKKDEASRKSYKLLVSLHSECGEIVKIVSDIGFIERECRNLQELIDIETTKEIAVKLKRLNEDLQQMKEENINLQKQVQ